jgi:hypothetical protein
MPFEKDTPFDTFIFDFCLSLTKFPKKFGGGLFSLLVKLYNNL